ncbi:MAG: hypothetical protein WAU70_05615 [Flavobacteriales bacterium]
MVHHSLLWVRLSSAYAGVRQGCTVLCLVTSFVSLAAADEAVREPLRFTENVGQVRSPDGSPMPQVLYSTSLPGAKVFVTTWGLSYFFLKPLADGIPLRPAHTRRPANGTVEWERVDMILEDVTITRAQCTAEGHSDTPDRFLINGSPIALEAYASERLTVRGILPGIDWVLTAGAPGEEGFKQEFVVAPGADASTIRMRYAGTTAMQAEVELGHLVATCGLGSIDDGAVKSFVGDRVVPSHYTTLGKNVFGFSAEDGPGRTGPLVIDPNIIVWSTYYGDGDHEISNAIFSDGTFVWACGQTSSTALPVLNPGGGAYYQGFLNLGSDAYLLKFSTTGIREWATYIGGNGDEGAHSVHSDGANVWLTGFSSSTDLPTLNPGGGAYFQGVKGAGFDMFLMKFTPGGTLAWSTYYGGDGTDAGTCVRSVGGSVYVCGYSQSSDLPVQNAGGGAYFQATNGGLQNAALLKFSTAGVRSWATYFGGDDTDDAASLSVNGTDLFVVGSVTSTNFPVLDAGSGAYYDAMPNGLDAFILRCNTSGVRLWCTIYGGNDDEAFQSVCADGTAAWVTGYAVSNNFPVFNSGGGAYYQAAQAGDQSAVILKFTNAGVRLWSTFYGGNVNTFGASIFSDGTDVWVAGASESKNLPVQDPGGGAFFQVHNSDLSWVISESWDMMLLQFNTSGVRQWATYYGKEEDDFGSCVMFDGIYLWYTGTTSSTDNYTVDPGGSAWFTGTCPLCGTFTDAAIIQFGVPIVLPVELLGFDAGCADGAVAVEWSTATETRSDHFTVQRSSEGEAWSDIGVVSGAGWSQTATHYAFTDRDPALSVAYYRLEQADMNGEVTLSPVAAVMPCTGGTVLDQWLLDAQGRICGKWPVADGSLAQGIYLVRREFTDGSTRTTKVAVQQQ